MIIIDKNPNINKEANANMYVKKEASFSNNVNSVELQWGHLKLSLIYYYLKNM